MEVKFVVVIMYGRRVCMWGPNNILEVQYHVTVQAVPSARTVLVSEGGSRVNLGEATFVFQIKLMELAKIFS